MSALPRPNADRGRLRLSFWSTMAWAAFSILPLLAGPATAVEIPDWYAAQKIAPASHEYIGYGEGPTLKEAKDAARVAIAAQIESQVESQSSKRERLSGDVYSSDSTHTYTVIASASLTDVTEVRRGHAGGRFYVAMKYLDLPLSKRAVVMLGEKLCAGRAMPQFLARGKTAQEIGRALGCAPFFEIKRTNATLRLYTTGGAVTLRQNEFGDFLPNIASDSIGIEIDTPSRVLKSGAYYFLTLQSRVGGYLSLFNLNEQGQVLSAFQNRLMRPGVRVTWPDEKRYKGLEAMVPQGMPEGRDAFVAVLTPAKIDFGLFVPLSADLQENGYDFESFVYAIDGEAFASLVVRVVR